MKKLKRIISDINLRGISTGTVVRTIMLVISMVIFVLKAFGVVLPTIGEDLILNVVITIFGVISFLQAYWKNNSITISAQKADELMQEKKAEVL